MVTVILTLTLGSSALAAKTPELPKAQVPATKLVTSQKPAVMVRPTLKPAVEHRIVTTPGRVRTSSSTVRPRIRAAQPALQMPSALRSLRYQLELHDMAAALRQ